MKNKKTLRTQATTPAIETNKSLQQKRSLWQRCMYSLWTSLGGMAFILAIVNIWYTHRQSQITKDQLEEMKRQNDLAEYNFMHATGGITAEMEFASFRPRPNDFGKEMRTTAFGRNDMPYYKDIGTFMKFRETLVLNNVGEEPIDAIRIVTRRIRTDVDIPNNRGNEDEFGLVREEERDEIILPQQWRPDTAIEISLLKGTLGQMVQIQSGNSPNVMHRAAMEVLISGRLSGSSVFGKGEPRRFLFNVWWLPTGFPEEKCREIINGYQSKVSFVMKQPISIPKLK